MFDDDESDADLPGWPKSIGARIDEVNIRIGLASAAIKERFTILTIINIAATWFMFDHFLGS